MSGTLYVCGTPIGNLEDITFRTIRILQEVDLIAAEDTRHTIKLLNHYEITTSLTSYHEHNKEEKGKKLIDILQSGKDIALVSDAGMPGISDPGEDLICKCIENNINVTAAPGPTAAITALVLSGLPTRSFVFEGFLPNDKKQRQKVLDKLKTETRTVIFYEAPHHLLKTLNLLALFVGERKVSALREITKKHEENIRGTISQVIAHFNQNEPRGEFVIIIQGEDYTVLENEEKSKWEELTIQEHTDIYMKKGNTQKESMKLVAKDRGISKRDVYIAVKVKNQHYSE